MLKAINRSVSGTWGAGVRPEESEGEQGLGSLASRMSHSLITHHFHSVSVGMPPFVSGLSLCYVESFLKDLHSVETLI